MSQTLADVFDAVAHKKLVQVDLPGKGSNQHELNGRAVFRQFFGSAEKVKGSLTWHYFVDDHEAVQEVGRFTFYDSRAKSASRTGRSEWRFYYDGEFLARCTEGDELFLVKTRSGAIHALIFQRNSAWLRSARLLFGLEDAPVKTIVIAQSRIAGQDLVLLRRQLLEELDIPADLTPADLDKELVERTFRKGFPSTKEMSAFARKHAKGIDEDVDGTLVAWLDREEQLFRALEEVIIGKRIKDGFETVEDFISFSLSVQNRRKSRMGHALENHLRELFTREDLRFTAQARTEGRRKPDFIFPGQAQYKNPAFDSDKLVMLGVKSSAKDRWRQILPEAERIPDKHLFTLQASISENQTDEMVEERVSLVVPQSIQVTYTARQRARLLDLAGFIDFVRSKQA